MKFLSDNIKELQGKTAILRLDLNINTDIHAKENLRFVSAVNSIKESKDIFSALYIISHRSDGSSLHEVFCMLKEYFADMQFVSIDDYFKDRHKGIYLFENIRLFEEETLNDKDFAKRLASLADVFVQDAFGVLHRQHASVVSLPEFIPSYVGNIVKYEIMHLNEALTPPNNSVFILGGAKFKTKLKLIQKLAGLYNKVVISGALANDVLKNKGFSVGASKVSDLNLKDVLLNLDNLILPYKYIALNIDTKEVRYTDGADIRIDEKIVDAFVEDNIIKQTDFLLWNGPFGWYENGFSEGTCQFLKNINPNSKNFAGGGDSDTILNICSSKDKFDFISTGGGAMLEYLLNETLPGIDVL